MGTGKPAFMSHMLKSALHEPQWPIPPGSNRVIVWYLRCPFFMKFWWGSRHFWSHLACLGYGLASGPTLKKVLSYTPLVGGTNDKYTGTWHMYTEKRDLYFSQQPAADMEPNQSQPQTQHSQCQFPINHRSSLKQLFSELISESHNQFFEELFQEVFWGSPLVSSLYPFADTTWSWHSCQPDLLQTCCTCSGIAKQQIPAWPSSKPDHAIAL